MPNDLNKNPEYTISEDPGDDIQQRYRYQAACAAIISLSLLSGDSEFECLFCEHHEDILIKKVDGKFIAMLLHYITLVLNKTYLYPHF